MREYRDGDRFGFCIFNFAVRPKKKPWPPETCDDFVEHILARFKYVYGFPATAIDVPEDYTGKEAVDNVVLRRSAKPVGHYYAYISEVQPRSS